MRVLVKELLTDLVPELPIVDPVYEFGSLQVAGQEGFADLRPLFADRTYVGSDMREGLGVDLVLDLHRLDLDDERVGTALLLDTLEHVEFPHRALQEVHRVLAPEGLVILTTVMDFPIHDYPYDYWRFTPMGIKSLLAPFAWSAVTHAGRALQPHTVMGIGTKITPSPSVQATIETTLHCWSKRWYLPGRSRWRAWAKLMLPPLLWKLREDRDREIPAG